MMGLAFVVLGIVYLLVPHFVLPLSFLQGGRSAWLLAECSFWFHPESLAALLALAGGLCFFRWRVLGRWLAGAAGLLLLLQALFLKPVSYYLQSEENLVIIGQTISLRAHSHLALFLAAGGVLLFALVGADLWLARRQRRHVSLAVLALANLRRKGFRTFALAMALAVVIGAFFTDVLLTRTIGNTLEVGVGRLGADLVVVPAGHEDQAREVLQKGTPVTFNLPPGTLEQITKLPEVAAASPQLFFRPFSYLVCCVTEQVLVVGYDPATDFTIGPWVHYFLREGQADDELVVGRRVKYYPGQQISVFGRLLTVAASLDFTGIGYFDRSAFIPLDGARGMIRDLLKAKAEEHLRERQAVEDLSLAHLFDTKEHQQEAIEELDPEGTSVIFVKVRPGVDVRELAERISTTIAGTSVVNIRAATTSIKHQLTAMLDAFFLPIVILMVMGTVILTAVFSMAINERQREIGLLRALGATRGEVFRLFLGEALLLAGLGAVFGILGGSAVVILFKERIMAALELIYVWPGPLVVLEVVGLTLLVTVCIGVGAGLWPARTAARLEPYQAFRNT